MKEMEFKVGDKIKVVSPDSIVSGYLKDCLFSNLNVNALRAYCKLVDNKGYKVVDVCRGCKRLYIEIGGKNLSLKYNQIIKI